MLKDPAATSRTITSITRQLKGKMLMNQYLYLQFEQKRNLFFENESITIPKKISYQVSRQSVD
jgi:hypothetical protein